MASDLDGDVDQGRVDMSMMFDLGDLDDLDDLGDLGKRHTPSDKLRSASEYHSWRHEVPLHRNLDICRACLKEVTCGSCEDLEGSSGSCARNMLGILGLEGIFHSAHNNWSAVAELALLYTRFMSIMGECERMANVLGVH